MSIPKILYLTYKNNPPHYVLYNWQKLNPDYCIDFSLDIHCIKFLITYFDENIVNMFKNISEGMFKADLWRLCKLYIHGGVYADIDLVPYISIDELIKTNYTFYSCLAVDKQSCFQAFIATEAKNPLILKCIFSFIQNKPYTFANGPCYDMYNCIKECLDIENILPEKEYNMNMIKMKINIGSSINNTKKINLYDLPETEQGIHYLVELCDNSYSDMFNFEINKDNKSLIITRIDLCTGWDTEHSVYLYISSGKIINIGSSDTNTKIINVLLNITDTIELCNVKYNDTFDFKINNNNTLTVTRTDKNIGWGHNHSIIINNKKNNSVFLFTELFENDINIVKLNNQKIFDSRYKSYTQSKKNNIWI